MDTTDDRFGFTLFIAAVLHAGLILGVGFSEERPGPRARSLEITLAQMTTERKIEDAKFLAQANQLGSGNDDPEDRLVSGVAGRMAPPTDQLIREMVRQTPETPSHDATAVQTDKSSLVLQQTRQHLDGDDAVHEQLTEPVAADPGIDPLLAKLDPQQRAYAERPRIEGLATVSAREAVDAEYLLNWKKHIESIGNKNYPLEARNRRLFGELRLLVAVSSDGHVKETRILQSSGERILDEAALRIVRLAEPFDPFPKVMRARTDIVEIIRTWQFRREGLSAK